MNISLKIILLCLVVSHSHFSFSQTKGNNKNKVKKFLSILDIQSFKEYLVLNGLDSTEANRKAYDNSINIKEKKSKLSSMCTEKAKIFDFLFFKKNSSVENFVTNLEKISSIYIETSEIAAKNNEVYVSINLERDQIQEKEFLKFTLNSKSRITKIDKSSKEEFNKAKKQKQEEKDKPETMIDTKGNSVKLNESQEAKAKESLKTLLDNYREMLRELCSEGTIDKIMDKQSELEKMCSGDPSGISVFRTDKPPEERRPSEFGKYESLYPKLAFHLRQDIVMTYGKREQNSSIQLAIEAATDSDLQIKECQKKREKITCDCRINFTQKTTLIRENTPYAPYEDGLEMHTELIIDSDSRIETKIKGIISPNHSLPKDSDKSDEIPLIIREKLEHIVLQSVHNYIARLSEIRKGASNKDLFLSDFHPRHRSKKNIEIKSLSGRSQIFSPEKYYEWFQEKHEKPTGNGRYDNAPAIFSINIECGTNLDTPEGGKDRGNTYLFQFKLIQYFVGTKYSKVVYSDITDKWIHVSIHETKSVAEDLDDLGQANTKYDSYIKKVEVIRVKKYLEKGTQWQDKEINCE